MARCPWRIEYWFIPQAQSESPLHIWAKNQWYNCGFILWAQTTKDSRHNHVNGSDVDFRRRTEWVEILESKLKRGHGRTCQLNFLVNTLPSLGVEDCCSLLHPGATCTCTLFLCLILDLSNQKIILIYWIVLTDLICENQRDLWNPFAPKCMIWRVNLKFN